MRSILGALVLIALTSAPAAAHETLTAGRMTLTLGWVDEPAYAGLPNGVELEAKGAGGQPVVDPSATLSVQVTFDTEAVTLAMAPEEAGRFVAGLIPTKAGSYSFNVSGTLAGQPVDIRSECSDATFDCVAAPSEIQFPVSEPAGAELAQRLQRETARVEDARSDASAARTLAGAALALAAVALILPALLRRRAAGKKV